MNDKIINVLYVDDEENNLISFTASFRRDFNVFTSSSAKESETILANNNIHVLITDQRMPDTLGTELLADAVRKYPNQSRILLTGYTDIEALIDAVNNGQIFKYLTKPWNEDLLKECIKIGHDLFLKKIMVHQDESRYNNLSEEIQINKKSKPK